MIVKNIRSPANWLVAAGVILVALWMDLRSPDKDQLALAPTDTVPEVGALRAIVSAKSPASVSNSDEEITRVTSSSRFGSDQLTDVWPPQPRGITGVRAVAPKPQLMNDAAGDFASAREIAEASDSVRVLLGRRYGFISERPKLAKWSKEHLGDEVVFYSYDQNITVIATIEQGQVVEVQGVLPTEFQPPLSPDEKSLAAELARDYWLASGDTRVDDLEAFSILTYDGVERHPVRMAYVTFHYTSTINPELLTWVDLTHERVDRSLIQRGGVGQ